MAAQFTTLPSGLRVVSDPMPHLKTAAVTVSVGVGARDEEDHEHGISHLLEHMAFKGTKRRSARDIAEVIEAVGGELNAATGSENTSYYVKLLGEDLSLGLDVLADILTDPLLDPAELAKEQNVIVQEIGAADDSPDDVIYDRFTETAFPEQTIGRSILGTPETVRSFSPQAIRAFLDRHYRSDQIVISAAGMVDHEHLCAEAERLFAPLAGKAGTAPRSARYQGGSRTEKRDLEQSHVVIGFPGFSYRDPAIYALGVFTSLLGGGMSSRLFQEVREERGLCYSIYSFHWPYHDAGIFGIGAGTDPNDLGDLVKISLDQMAEAAETATEAEVNRAKAQMKVGMLATLESSGARAEQLARQVMIFGQPTPLDTITARIEAVNVDEVRRVGRSLFEQKAITFTALGPLHGMDKARQHAESFGLRE